MKYDCSWEELKQLHTSEEIDEYERKVVEKRIEERLKRV